SFFRFSAEPRRLRSTIPPSLRFPEPQNTSAPAPRFKKSQLNEKNDVHWLSYFFSLQAAVEFDESETDIALRSTKMEFSPTSALPVTGCGPFPPVAVFQLRLTAPLIPWPAGVPSKLPPIRSRSASAGGSGRDSVFTALPARPMSVDCVYVSVSTSFRASQPCDA